MRKVKWVFFAYLAVVVSTVVAIAVAFNAAPDRDPNTYYVVYTGAIKTLDPAECGDQVGSYVLSPVVEGLYNFKYGRTSPYELYPELAAAMPTTSADGLTMTIHVRPGIHYYDPEHAVWPDGVGPEVTAADFVYSFKRVCDYHTNGPNYSGTFQGHLAGVDDWWAYTKGVDAKAVDYDRPVAGMTVDPHDRHTLVLRFTAPYPQMVFNLVNPQCAPVSRDVVNRWGDQVRKHLVGTGAYVLAEYLREQRLTYTPNPVYRGRPDVDGDAVVAPADRLPKIKRIEEDFFQDELPPWFLFKQGLFDVEGIPKDAFASAVAGGGTLTPDMTDRGVVLHKTTDPTVNYVGFNLADPVIGKNRPLRRAMSLAFDRRTYIAKFANGRGEPAIGPIPPGFPTFDPNRVNPWTQYDPVKAREQLAEAVKINGGPLPPIHILFRGADTADRQQAEFYVDQMAKVGITVQPDFRDFARYLQMVDDRQMVLYDAGWVSDYPDEQDFFQLFYGPNAPAGGLNASNYQNPAFDKLYEQATTQPDSPARRAMYLQMAKMIEDDCVWLISDYPKTFHLAYDYVGNHTTMDYGHGDAQHYTLDTALRTRRLADRRRRR